jgi:hypothetical protein
MPQRVQADASVVSEPGSSQRPTESIAGGVMAVGLPVVGAEHEVVAGPVGSDGVMTAQEHHDGVGEQDLPLGGGGSRAVRLPVPAELLLDSEFPGQSKAMPSCSPKVRQRVACSSSPRATASA